MDDTQAYDILGLKPGATRFEVRQAYHDLLHVWQPDRVGKNLRLQKRAKEQLALINEAYELLEGALSKAAEAAPADTPALLPESEDLLDDLSSPAGPAEAATVFRKTDNNPASVPILGLDYVPDGPPPPKVPLAARMRETRAEVKQHVAKGVATAIPFRRRNVILACVAVVVIPVSVFFITQFFRGNHDQTNEASEPVSRPPRAAPDVPTSPGQTAVSPVVAADDPQPTTTPGLTAATIATAPPVATGPAPDHLAKADPAPAVVQPDPGPDPRIALIAELAKMHVTAPTDSTVEQLNALLVRAKMASDLAASGFKLDPLRVSLEMMNQYQARADLAGQINQLAKKKILASEFTLSQLREMRVSAGMVAEIAENGSNVDMNRYTRNELEDLLQRSRVAHELQTKYGVTVDITAHPAEELELMLKHAQDQRATGHP